MPGAPIDEVLKAAEGRLDCGIDGCLRTDFLSDRARRQHWRMAHDYDPQPSKRRDYYRQYSSQEKVRRYQRQYRRKKRREDPNYAEADRRRAREYARNNYEARRIYQRARTMALQALARKYPREYEVLLTEARKVLEEQGWRPKRAKTS